LGTTAQFSHIGEGFWKTIKASEIRTILMKNEFIASGFLTGKLEGGPDRRNFSQKVDYDWGNNVIS
jgi:hypothetical protein